VPDRDAVAFDRRVSALLRAAATAERDDLARVLAEIHAAQVDMAGMMAGSDAFGVKVATAQRRLVALEAAVSGMIGEALPSAALRGVGLVDAGLDAAGLAVRAGTVPESVDAAVEAMRAGARKHIADVHARVVHELMLGRDDVAAVVRAIGSELRGSPVFGGPASFLAGQLRASLGDVTGAAVTSRSAELEAAGGPRTLKRWVHTAGIKEPRQSHVTAASRYAAGIPWGQKFEIGSYRTMYPRGAGLPGTHRFGCRCQVAPVLVTEE
jgi:hypothetical protein